MRMFSQTNEIVESHNFRFSSHLLASKVSSAQMSYAQLERPADGGHIKDFGEIREQFF